jgi:hypothetical protein
VFNANSGVMDGYSRYTDIPSFESDGTFTVNCDVTTGIRNIYVIANSHRSDWSNITNEDIFLNEIASLENESIGNWLMRGAILQEVIEIESDNTIAISLERIVARVSLESIKTNFSGTPYAGESLENVKVYLLNAVGDYMLWRESSVEDGTIFNKQKLDDSGFGQSDMLFDSIDTKIGDAGYQVSHIFHTFENDIQGDNSDCITKLIIQGDLNGTTYYYPININQEGYGYSAENGHYGVKANYRYNYNVTINRPGTTDPNKDINKEVITLYCTIANWRGIISNDVEF